MTASSSLYSRLGKRLLDVTLAGTFGLLAAPLLLVVAILVGLRLGCPILFRQPRPGLGGHPFTLLKFRTMTEDLSEDGQLAPDAERLTALGRFLRKWSLDELPELWNVLRGDMSLVGPRPLLLEYLDRYTPQQARRHEVRPGITGWAQINGRNVVTWEERFELDVWYVDHLGLSLDLVILARTMWKILRGEGISAPGHATKPRFRGTGGE